MHYLLVKSRLCRHKIDTVQVGVGVEGSFAECLEKVRTVSWVHHPEGALAQVLKYEIPMISTHTHTIKTLLVI